MQTLKRLMVYMRPYKGKLIVAMISIVLYVVLSSATPYLVGMATTRVSVNIMRHEHIDFHYVALIIGIFIIACIAASGLQYLANALLSIAVQKSMHSVRTDLAYHLDHLPLAYIDQQKQGDLLSRMTNDVDAVANALQQSFLTSISSALTLIAAVGMMFWMNWKLALIAILMIPASLIIMKWLMKKAQPFFIQQQQAIGRLQSVVKESMNGFEVLKLYNQEASMTKTFLKANHSLSTYSFKAQLISGILMPLVNLTAYAAYIVVAVVGCLLCFSGALVIGQVQAFLQYVWQINQPLSQVSQLVNAMQSAFAGLSRIFDVLDTPVEVQPSTKEEMPAVKGSVTFEHVDFSYQAGTPILKDLSLEVQQGQTVAIVGPTGAGKSTIVNLLMRFYQPTNGRIMLDGKDIQSLPHTTMRRHIAMVLQDTWLYEASILENIRFGRLDATDDEIRAVVKLVQMDQYIEALPDGYHTILHADQQALSQGQIQLLTIARAMISQPELLILDEATSAIDTKIEQQVQKAMTLMMKGRTSFVIAHRLSTIRDADMIVMLDHGRIVENGTHDALLQQDGAYAKLYRSQFVSEV